MSSNKSSGKAALTAMDSAVKLFKIDNSAIAQRDRRTYREFDDMPLGLQKWWRDRADWYAKEGKYGMTKNRAEELADIFEKASNCPTNIIDPPFDCVPINLRPATCKEVADLLRSTIKPSDR